MNNVIQTKDLLTMLVSSITIIVAIYYALNVFLNMEKEEKIMNIYGYNRKSINFPLISFIIVYSIFPIFGLIFYKLDNNLLESVILFTSITIYFIFHFSPRLNKLILGILILFTSIGIGISIYNTIGIGIYNAIGIGIVISIVFIIIVLVDRKRSLNKFSNNNDIYFFISPITVSCSLYDLIIYFQLIPLEEDILKNFNFIFIGVYCSIGLFIFNLNYNKYKEKEIKKIEITLKKDIAESNQYKYENKIGFIISETNDDIVFDIDRVLHRYRKSDIYCIKEIEESNLDLLNIIINDIQSLKKDIDSIKLSKYKEEKIKPEIEDIYYKLLNLQKKMK